MTEEQEREIRKRLGVGRPIENGQACLLLEEVDLLRGIVNDQRNESGVYQQGYRDGLAAGQAGVTEEEAALREEVETAYTEDGIRDLQRRLEDMMRTRPEAMLNRFRVMLKALRKKCKHGKTTYYPDPSGNNDSETLCDLCGAEVRR